MKSTLALAALAPVALAEAQGGWNWGWNWGSNWGSGSVDVSWLNSACGGSGNAQKFCTSYLPQSTKTVTACGGKTTITNAPTTKTVTVPACTTTSTSTSVAWVSTTSIAFSTITCTPAGSSIPPAAASTTAAAPSGLSKRTWPWNQSPKWKPHGWCFQWDWPYDQWQHPEPSISAACSVVAPCPTTTTTTFTQTVTKSGSVCTSTVTPATSTITAMTTVTSTATTVVTSTEVEPSNPTGTMTVANQTFYDYSNIDFQRGDLDNYTYCPCDSDGSGGDCTIRGIDYGKCFGFASCQTICAQINTHYGNETCVGVTYNGPDVSGACYFKSSLEGCGVYNDGRRSGLILDY